MSASTDALLHTPLDALHRELGARMVPFAGYAMPVQYPAGLLAEHHHTRQAASLFDVSHMGQIRLLGAGASEALERLIPMDVQGLGLHRQRYGLLLDGHAGILDDLMFVNRGVTDGGDLFLIVNGACKHADLAHIERHLGTQCTVQPQYDRGLLALQGPLAAVALARLLPQVQDLVFMTGLACTWEGANLYITRSGYTGEDGFEIYAAADKIVAIWDSLMDTGAGRGMKPAGLGARDTLRLESGMMLNGQDISQETCPLEVPYAWLVDWNKDFAGKPALAAIREKGIRKKLAGFEMTGRGIARHGYPVSKDGREIGYVTSGTFSPTLNKAIGLAFIDAENAEPDAEIAIGIRDAASGAKIVRLPFYKRQK